MLCYGSHYEHSTKQLSSRYQQTAGSHYSQEIETSNVDTSDGVILNFRDPDYSAESGGYHPVEICVNAQGRIQYITDFAYYGQGPYAELGKELDFDFGYGVFQQMGREFPIRDGANLFKIWQSQFLLLLPEPGIFGQCPADVRHHAQALSTRRP